MLPYYEPSKTNNKNTFNTAERNKPSWPYLQQRKAFITLLGILLTKTSTSAKKSTSSKLLKYRPRSCTGGCRK